MRSYTFWSVLCLLAAVPLAVRLLLRNRGEPLPVVRIATFNVAMHRDRPAGLLDELRAGSPQARRIAEIVQRAAVDVVLLQEFDRDDAGEALQLFSRDYLAVSQNGQPPIEFEFSFAAPVNTGEPTGFDLDGDGRTDGPGDAHGYGAFPGQYGMALLSRHPILVDRVRTFQLLGWHAMPGALRPPGHYADAAWQALRLSSKSHWDVPIGIGDHVLHVLCSHPTPPVFDGPEDRNGRRNHDEIRFWVDYLTPGNDAWITDDHGGCCGLAANERFVLLGDFNCDPADGDGRREALLALLAHPRVQDPRPRSRGGAVEALRQFGVNSRHQGDPGLDTSDFPDRIGEGPGNLRVDYVLPSAEWRLAAAGVFWPVDHEPGSAQIGASDHRLVFVDLIVDAPRRR